MVVSANFIWPGGGELMVFLIDPEDVVKGGNGCKRKNCTIVCKLCTPLFPLPLYSVKP